MYVRPNFCRHTSGNLSKYAAKSKLGRPAIADDIRARDISVGPHGEGLPPGHGTAREGQGIYQAKCAACHGDQGQGGVKGWPPALAGGQGTLAGAKPVQTVGSFWPSAVVLWDYIHRSMPYPPVERLRPDEVYAVTAYVLYLNHIIAQDERLNQKTLPAVAEP